MADHRDYEVGRGRPPKHSQFKKGVSGNPRGRPRWKRSEAEILAKIRDERVSMTLNGKSVQVSMFEALIRRAVVTTVNKGGIRECEMLVQLFARFAAPPAEVEGQKAKAAADAVMARILDYFDKTVPDDEER
jgi:hypothetical protein